VRNNLAPIGLSTYTRLEHLKQTVEALQQNELASESELYVFSDAPKAGDEEKIQAVRGYLKTINGFKAVHIIERKENNRVANNRGGMKHLLDQYGKCIFMEDDTLTAPGFLSYMNGALEFYQTDERITFISGYVVPGINLGNDYEKDVFLLGYFESWGMGLWERSFKYFNYIPKEKYEEVYNNKSNLKALRNRTGENQLDIITRDYLGEMDGGDIKIWFWQYVYGTYSLYPKKTLVESIGQDGSGVHMGITDKWDVDALWDKTKFKFVERIEVNPKIEKMNYNFYKRTGREKLASLLKSAGVYCILRPIYKRLKG